MATYYARKTGNVNATDVWATTPTGTAQAVTFVSGDVLVSNSFNITVNVSVDLGSTGQVRNDTTGGATQGGRFELSNGTTLTANVFGGNASLVPCVLFNSTGTVWLVGNIKANSSGNNTNCNAVSSTGSAGSVFNITGNITGGDSNGANCHGVSHTGAGTLNVFGTVSGGSVNQNHGISASAGTINITGNVVGTTGTSYGLSSSGTNVNIIGNIIAGSGSNGIGAFLSGSGSINITGNVSGGSGSQAYGILTGGSATINITGNIIGGSNSSGFGTMGVMHRGTSSATINITGTATGGSAGGPGGGGAVIDGVGIINIIGTAVGGVNAPGATIWLGQNGTLTATRAKGNGFGNGSAGLTSQPGVAGLQTGLCRVYEVEYGDLGQSPTSGPVFLFPATSNVALFYRSGTSKKTLVDATSSSGLLPNASDVRSGISYNAGNNVGTMGVPGAASVASGVAVDNTTGTAILTTGNIADIWNYPTSGISVSNSIGERLKNCSTVATMGQQLAASVSNIN